MNYREKIRKAIECPQLNNTRYGEWGALTLEQRKYIKRLLDELDSADNYIKNVYLENNQLKENWNKLKEIVKSQSGFKKRADLKGGLWFEIDELLDKMQEMEKNYGNVEDNT